MNPLDQLRISIRNLNAGDDLQVRKQELLSLIDEAAAAHGHPGADSDVRHETLSPREREIMNRILTGQRLKQIGAELDISVKTVTTHRTRLLRKLKLEDNLGLYRYGVRNGLISI